VNPLSYVNFSLINSYLWALCFFPIDLFGFLFLFLSQFHIFYYWVFISRRLPSFLYFFKAGLAIHELLAYILHKFYNRLVKFLEKCCRNFRISFKLKTNSERISIFRIWIHPIPEHLPSLGYINKIFFYHLSQFEYLVLLERELYSFILWHPRG